MRESFEKHKTNLVNENEVRDFLRGYHNTDIYNLKILSGGNHSEAFGYIAYDKEYVARFNEKKEGFLKDDFAYKFFSGSSIPIPEIISIGDYKENIYYSISNKVIGETIRNQYNNGDFSSLPVQFEMLEKIKNTSIIHTSGFGEWGNDGNAKYKTMDDYVMALYGSRDYFDWDELKKIESFNKEFADYLSKQIYGHIQFLDQKRSLMHGDFDKNVFINNGEITGIIDWEKSRYGDHFLDVGRIVLFCPNREATVSAALSFYKNKDYKNYKERIMFGVYFAMLSNYGFAVLSGNKESYFNYPNRIKEIEDLMYN